MDFPKGTSSFLLKKHGLSHMQTQAIIKHISFAEANYKNDELMYSWWDKSDDYYLDSWRVIDNYGRIFLWTAYDSFSMGRFVVKLLGERLANDVWIDSWHSLYTFDSNDKYFVAAKLAASTTYEV